MTASQENELTPEEVEAKQVVARDRRWLGVGIGIFVVIVGVVGGVGYVQHVSMSARQQIGESANLIVSEPDESAKPAVVEPQSYTVKILNGSGVTGAAGKAAKELGDSNQELVIATGNARAQTGDTLSYINEHLRRGSFAGMISALYPEAAVSVNEEQVEDLIITLGK